jgi:hypothetical protein
MLRHVAKNFRLFSGLAKHCRQDATLLVEPTQSPAVRQLAERSRMERRRRIPASGLWLETFFRALQCGAGIIEVHVAKIGGAEIAPRSK